MYSSCFSSCFFSLEIVVGWEVWACMGGSLVDGESSVVLLLLRGSRMGGMLLVPTGWQPEPSLGSLGPGGGEQP